MTNQQKVFFALAGVVGAYGLYVYFRRNQSGSGGGAVPVVYAGGTVSPNVDFGNLQAEIRAGLGELQKQMQASDAAFGGLLAQQGNATVKAINDQSAAFQSAISSLAQAESDAFRTLGKAITDGFSAQGKALTDLINSISTQIGGRIDAVIQRITDFENNQTKLISEVRTDVGRSNSALASLQSAVETVKQGFSKQSDIGYLAVGTQSVAACMTPSGEIDATCVKTHAIDLPSGLFSASQVPAYVRSKYSDCMKGALPDLVCVGKKIAAERGVTG